MKVDSAPAVTVGVGCLASLVMYPELPGPFLRSVQPSALVSPLVAFGLPSAAIVTYLILRRLWSEVPTEPVLDAESEAAHRAIAMRVVVFIISLHVLVLLNLSDLLGMRAWGPRLVVVLFGGVIIAIGDLLPRTRPNLALGIRTARTLTNRPFWIALHRTGGYVAVALGTVIVLSGLFLNDPTLEFVVGTAALGSVATMAYAYQRQCRG